MCAFDAPPERVRVKKTSTERSEVNNVCVVWEQCFIFDYLVLG